MRWRRGVRAASAGRTHAVGDVLPGQFDCVLGALDQLGKLAGDADGQLGLAGDLALAGQLRLDRNNLADPPSSKYQAESQ